MRGKNLNYSPLHLYNAALLALLGLLLLALVYFQKHLLLALPYMGPVAALTGALLLILAACSLTYGLKPGMASPASWSQISVWLFLLLGAALFFVPMDGAAYTDTDYLKTASYQYFFSPERKEAAQMAADPIVSAGLNSNEAPPSVIIDEAGRLLVSEDNYVDLMTDFHVNPQNHDGVTIKMVGRAILSPDQPTGRFYLSRLYLTCCAADLTPVGLSGKPAEGMTLEPDGWYEIVGTLHSEVLAGETKPFLEILSATPVPVPVSPYVY